MRALKVLYRDSVGQLWSALPTRFRLGYAKGVRTTPWHGKAMVYLESDLESARCMCVSAAKWYFAKDVIKGSMEIWRVECHNLYLMQYIIYPQRLTDVRWLREFWNRVDAGVGFSSHTAWPIGWTALAHRHIWSTDWVVPMELIMGETLSEMYAP